MQAAGEEVDIGVVPPRACFSQEPFYYYRICRRTSLVVEMSGKPAS